MEVKNKTMYHIHTPNEYDKLWQEGNILYIDNNFLSESGIALNYFNTSIEQLDGSFVMFDEILKKHLEQGIENLDEKTIKELLEDTYQVIDDINRMRCEWALEMIRESKFNIYPSRLHSLVVISYDSIKFWLNELVEKEVFELELTGTLFKTSDIYIPDDNMCNYQAMEIAEDYWNPTFTKEAEEKKEYLFQGKALIKRKIK